MLETKGLCKLYKPKKGVPVKAIDNVSLIFPEKGMVFLLGKSGSGKSTLLNLLGGLDKYDAGEIIIKGVSSKNFNQQSFDSYRNTYVGFIFQEYNVLQEFTVGANIALALELQGKKATDEAINRILEDVDLAGYGARRPNELSGGQLQRVAIARALVKNPEIIMADEPTGALDSNTGRQVLETLKKLSEKKLVIVVSHDREFAERYADRIIELADGRVIRDVEWKAENEDGAKALSYSGDTISVPAGYRLTEEDREAINKYIEDYRNGVNISIQGRGRTFTKTDLSKLERRDGSDFKLIKSKLPLKSAFRIGGSGLKHKKFRLVITVILSMIAFTLFALADTFGSYQHVRTCVDSLMDSGITYASVMKSVKVVRDDDFYWNDYTYRFTEEDLETFREKTGVSVRGVYVPDNISLSLTGSFDGSVELSKTDYNIYASGFSGFAEVTNEDLAAMGYEILAGKLPDGGKNEIAISRYVCETYIKAGYSDGTVIENPDGKLENTYQKISSYGDMVGKTLIFGDTEYKITGVVETNFNFERYAVLMEESQKEKSAAEELVEYALFSEFGYDRNYSLGRVAFVGNGFIDRFISGIPKTRPMNMGYFNLMASDLAGYQVSNFYFECYPTNIATLADADKEAIRWLGEEKTVLGEREVVIADDSFYTYGEIGGAPLDTYFEDRGEILSALSGISGYGYSEVDCKEIENDGWEIVGYIDTALYPEYSDLIVGSDSLCRRLSVDNGRYSFAVGPMPESRSELYKFVESCYDESGSVRYVIQNPVTYELDIVHEVLKVLSKVFLFIGIGFALFAALLLANFIATSISYKKQEIGILRAIGSRSADVFRIFFSESFIIAMINFVLSLVSAGIITAVINLAIRQRLGVLITVLHFGVRQIALLFAVSIFVAALASFLPVKRIASKRPIDAIRNR